MISIFNSTQVALLGCLNTSSSGQRTSSRSLCFFFKLKTDGKLVLGHALSHLTTTQSVHLTTPTNLLVCGIFRVHISHTLRKAQVKLGLNVRLILCRDLAKASKRVAKTPFFGKFYLLWSKECVKTTTML